jgi:cytidylate kinase
MAKKIINTIDGWSSCGKVLLARQLAKSLNTFILTGNVPCHNLVHKLHIGRLMNLTVQNIHYICSTITLRSEMFINDENVGSNPGFGGGQRKKRK